MKLAGTGLIDENSVEKIANLVRPVGLVMDARVFTYVADTGSNVVFRLDPWAVSDYFVGDGIPGFSGDGASADGARVNAPHGLAVDADANLFVADTGNHRIRRVDAQTQIITTVAGSDQTTLSGVGGPATAAGLPEPTGVAVDPNGGLYIADATANEVFFVGADGLLTPFAGGGSAASDAAPANPADLKLNRPIDLALGHDGTLYIAEETGRRVTAISPSGQVTIAGDATGRNGYALVHPRGLGVEPDNGTLYIADDDRILSYAGGQLAPFAGTGQPGFTDAATPLLDGTLFAPCQMTWDSWGNRLEIADTDNAFLRLAQDGMLKTFTRYGFAGYASDPMIGKIVWPEAVAVDSQDRVLLTNPGHRLVWRIDPVPGAEPPDTLTLLMGDGSLQPVEGAFADHTGLTYPSGLTVAPDGSTFIADRDNHEVVKIGADHRVGRVAGTGSAGFSGDGGAGRNAALNGPTALLLDGSGALYIADTGNNRVRRLDPDGSIATLAGTGTAGDGGDNGPAAAAELNGPTALALDGQGRLYIADTGNDRIRRVDSVGTISTVAGTGEDGFGGDGGPAANALLSGPRGVWVDGAGALYISDSNNNRIRRVGADGTIQTIAGTGDPGNDGDASDATTVRLYAPAGLSENSLGDLIFADRNNHQIRSLTRAAAPLGGPLPAGPKAAASAPPASVPGDINGDGKLSVRDVTMALQIAVGVTPPSAEALAAGDFNHDGRIDIGEVVRILQAAVGLIQL